MWTTDKPTEPGLYMTRVTMLGDVGAPRTHELERHNGLLFARGDCMALETWAEYHEWLGPFTAEDVERGIKMRARPESPEALAAYATAEAEDAAEAGREQTEAE